MDVGIYGYADIEMQGYPNMEMHASRDIGMQGYRFTVRIAGYRFILICVDDADTDGYADIERSWDIRTQGCRRIGYRCIWIEACRDMGVDRYEPTTILGVWR